MKIVFTKLTQKQWGKLSKAIKDKIGNKLIFYLSQNNPLDYAKKMRGAEDEYRFRIGDW